jgi:hypothetical protein
LEQKIVPETFTIKFFGQFGWYVLNAEGKLAFPFALPRVFRSSAAAAEWLDGYRPGSLYQTIGAEVQA